MVFLLSKAEIENLNFTSRQWLFTFRIPSSSTSSTTRLNNGRIAQLSSRNVPNESLRKELYVWWPTMNKEIEQLVSSCATCAGLRNQGPVTPLHPWKWPTRVYERVHIDYAEMEGQNYLVIVELTQNGQSCYICNPLQVLLQLESYVAFLQPMEYLRS